MELLLSKEEEERVAQGFGDELDFDPDAPAPKSTPPSALFQGAYLSRQPRRMVMMGKSTSVLGSIKKANAYTAVSSRICMSSQELNDTLNIKVEAGIGVEGIGSASAKFGLVNSVGVSNQDVVIVVYAKHIPWTAFAQDYRLKPGIIKDHMFTSYYGDRWVSKITEGSEFALLYNFKAYNQSQRRDILGALQAQGVFFGADLNFDASVESKVKKVMTRFTCSSKCQIMGISSPDYPDPSKDEMSNYIRKFLKTKPDAPQIVEMDFTDYYSVPV